MSLHLILGNTENKDTAVIEGYFDLCRINHRNEISRVLL